MSRTIRRMSALALILAVACSSGTPNPTEGRGAATGSFDPTSVLQPDGPLRGLSLTRHIDRSDPAFGPTLMFTSNDTEATAVVGLGDVAEGSPLTVTWYRLTGIDERELLFSHEIAVGPGGDAFSQGIAAGGLAPGAYETVATMDEYVVHTPWIVREAKATPTVGAKARAVGTAAESDYEPWNTPESGDSGWYEPQSPPSSPSPPGPCEVASVHTGFDPLTDVSGSVYWIGECTHMSLTATVSGPPQEIASKEITEGSPPFLPGTAGLCELPGGSDLPGTVVHWSAAGSDGATGSATFAVPDFGETLEAIVQAAEGTPSRVDPGYKIKLRGMAIVMPPALGIKGLSLFAGEELIQRVGNASGTNAPQACDAGRLGAVNRAQYTVPADPPPVIHICAEAVGFDGTESRNCIQFYTGEVWKGTAKSKVTSIAPSPPSPCGDPIEITSKVELVVAADGSSVTGTYDATGCGVSEPHADFTGTATDAGFQFPRLLVFTNGELIPKVSSTQAEGTFTNLQGEVGVGGAKWVTTWNLTCESCDGANNVG